MYLCVCQAPEDGEEDEREALKRHLRAERQKRKKRLLEQSSLQKSRDADDVTSIQQYSADEGPSEKADDSVVLSKSRTGSQKGLTSRTQHTQHLDDFVKRRLEEKLKAARSKGESLQDKEASLEFPSRLHSLRDRDTVTRFDREADADRAGRRDSPPPLSTRVRFREAARQVGKGLPTAEEAFNFFTLNFDPDPPDVIETSSRRRQKQRKTTDEDEEHEDVDEDIQEENETQSEEAPLVQTQEDLFVIDQSPQDFLEIKKAEYVGYQKLLQRQSELLFTPSFRTVPTSIKLPENMKPRYLEDEGLYVGERPPVSLTNENILENRILKMEEGKKWFGDDGRIIALPNPIKESSTRPPLFHMEEALDPALQTVYRKV